MSGPLSVPPDEPLAAPPVAVPAVPPPLPRGFESSGSTATDPFRPGSTETSTNRVSAPYAVTTFSFPLTGSPPGET